MFKRNFFPIILVCSVGLIFLNVFFLNAAKNGPKKGRSVSAKPIEQIISNEPYKLDTSSENLAKKAFVIPQALNIDKQNSKSGHHPRFPKSMIVGTTRCGTGVLQEYLNRNPFVAYSDKGDSHFFDQYQNYVQGYRWYLNWNPSVSTNVRTYDKTATYLSDPTVPAKIHAYYPDTKLIFLVCDPLHRTLSNYLQACHEKKDFASKYETYNEAIRTGLTFILQHNMDLFTKVTDINREFTEYSELRETIYKFLDDPVNFKFIKVPTVELILRGAYAYHIHQYLKFFPRENMLLINSNDLKTKPGTVMQTVQEFMDVPVVIDDSSFTTDEEFHTLCVRGPGEREPYCTVNISNNKNQRTVEHMHHRVDLKLSRVFKALQPDLENLGYEGQFADWTFNISIN